LPLWQWTTTEKVLFLLRNKKLKTVISSAGHFLEGAAGCNICHYPQPPVPFLYGDDIYYNREGVKKKKLKYTGCKDDF
jgi:hypothetical protein